MMYLCATYWQAEVQASRRTNDKPLFESVVNVVGRSEWEPRSRHCGNVDEDAGERGNLRTAVTCQCPVYYNQPS